VEERTDEGLRMKVGGYKSYFLNAKEGRKHLPEAVIKAREFNIIFSFL
jgi:hypothetical protein